MVWQDDRRKSRRGGARLIHGQGRRLPDLAGGGREKEHQVANTEECRRMLGESECICPCVFSECCSWEWDSGGGGGNGWSRRRRRQIFSRVELDLCGISERRHARQSGCIGHIF